MAEKAMARVVDFIKSLKYVLDERSDFDAGDGQGRSIGQRGAGFRFVGEVLRYTQLTGELAHTRRYVHSEMSLTEMYTVRHE